MSTDDERAGPVPVAVVAVTVLFGLLVGLWTVAVPQGRAPDEPAHVDLVLAVAEDPSYPASDGRLFGRAVGLSRGRHLVDLAEPWPRFAAADAPPRTSRPDLWDLGGTAPDPSARSRVDDEPPPAGAPYVYNQMPQHPPLYYEAMAAVLRVERALLPGSRPPPLDREIGLLRLVNALLLLPLPALAWLTTRRLGGSHRAGTVAALLVLGLPQLTHIGAAVNGDNLFTLLAAGLAALLAGVARGQRTARTDVAVGLVLGLAFWSKAFALALLPWLAAAYAVAWWSSPAGRARVARGLALASAVTVAVGAWWWVANLVRFGEPAPTSENLTRTAAGRPEGFRPDASEYAWRFVGRLARRTWAWIGFGTPKVELPGEVIGVFVALVVGALVVAAVTARGGPSTTAGPRRRDVALALVPITCLVAFVARRAWGLHTTTGAFAFVQGRYLFCAVVPIIAVVAVGTARALGRWAPATALVGVVSVQAWTLARVVTACWAGPGLPSRLGALLAWSPWPAPLVVAAAGGTIVAIAATAATCRPGRGTVEEPTPG